MKLEFDYEKAIDRCKMLSSFEGRNNVSDSGNSLFLETKITQQDEPLIISYFNTAALTLEEGCARVIRSSKYNSDGSGFVWDMLLDERWNGERDFYKYVEEALVSYAVYKWAEEHKATRVDAYKTIWEEMATRVLTNVFRRTAPIKRKRAVYDEFENNDITIING